MKTIKIIALILILFISSVNTYALNSFSHSIVFDADKSILNANDRIVLRSFLDSVLNTNDVIRIEVLGYCDDGEYRNFFLDLSKKRSKFITKELKLVFKSQELKTINWCIKTDNPSLSEEKLDKLLEKTRRIDIVFNINTESSRAIKKGDTFILNGILFQGGDDILLEESMATLKTLYKELIKYPQLVIQIQGHIYDTDFVLSDSDSNITLSARRAKRIYDYLLFKGIDAKRLSYIGLEGQFPLHKGPKYDRRVEVEIVNI